MSEWCNHDQIQLGLFNEKTPPLIIQKGYQLAKCGVRKQHEKKKQKKTTYLDTI